MLKKVLLFALLFVAWIAASAEDVGKVDVFLDVIPDRGVRLLRDFEKASADNDVALAARLYQSLLSSYSESLVEQNNGLYLPVREIINPIIAALGEKGIEAFRNQFDPAASLLRDGYLNGDISQSEALVRVYPYSTYAPEAICHLAAYNADMGRFHLSAAHLENLFSMFPAKVPEYPAAVALLARCYASLGDAVKLEKAIAVVRNANISSTPFGTSTLGQYIESLKKEIRTTSESGWNYPAGDPAGSQKFATNVRNPMLLWSATIVPHPVAKGSAIEEAYSPVYTYETGNINYSVRPVIRDGKVFFTDGTFAYSRDIETGFLLNQYPPGRNLEITTASPAVDSGTGTLGLSVAEGKVFSCFQSSTIGSYYSNLQIEGYSEKGADALVDALKIRFSKDLTEIQSVALSSMTFISVPIVFGGQVFAVGESGVGMIDAYALSFDSSTGQLLWMTRLFTYSAPQNINRSRMTVIPSIDAGRMVAAFNGGVVCLSASDGRIRWINGYERVKIPSSPVEPPCILSEHDVVIAMPYDSKGAAAYSISTGKLLYTIEEKGIFLGIRGNEAYFDLRDHYYAISVKDGLMTKKNLLPSSQKSGIGAVTNDALILPIGNELVYVNPDSGKVIKRFFVSRSEKVFLGRILPYGDYIICATPEMLYCIVDGTRIKAELERMRNADPLDPVPHLRAGLLAMYAEDDTMALSELKTALALSKPDSTYMDYRVTELVRAYMTSYFIRIAEREVGRDPEKILRTVEIALDFADHVADRRFLYEIQLNAALKLKRHDIAMDALVEIVAFEDDGRVQPYEYLLETLKGWEIITDSDVSQMTLRQICSNALVKLASIFPQTALKYEETAAKLSLLALNGDVEALQAAFGKYFFTDATLALARQLSRRVFENSLDPALAARFLLISAEFPIDRCPEVAMARGVLQLSDLPGIAEKVIYDIGRHFPDASIEINGKQTSLGELSLKYVLPEKYQDAPAQRTDLTSGVAVAWSVDLERDVNSNYVYEPFVFDKGVVIPTGGNNDLSCFSHDGNLLWKIQSRRRAFVGVSLQNSELPPGALVVQVIPGFPAEAAGVAMGDVIVEFNDVSVDSHAELIDAIAGIEPGKPTTMKVIRHGEVLQIAIVPGERTGEHFVPDQVIRMFESGDCMVAMRRSLTSTSFYFERIRLLNGEIVWRKDFDRVGYPSAPERFGDLVIMYCTSYDRIGMSAIVVFDIATGQGRIVQLDRRNFYGNIYAFSGGRLVMMESSGSSTFVVFDIFSGQRLITRKSPMGMYYSGKLDRYIIIRDRTGSSSVDIYSGKSASQERPGMFITASGDQLLFRSNDGTGLDLVSSSDLNKVIQTIPSTFRTTPSKAFLDSEMLIMQTNEYRFARNNNSYGFSQLSCFGLAENAMRWTTSLPYGAYLREMNLQAGNALVQLQGQQGNFNGMIVVDTLTGQTVMRLFVESITGIRSSIGKDALYVDDGSKLTAWRACTEEDRDRLKRQAQDAVHDLPDWDEMNGTIVALLNARLPRETIDICDTLRGMGGDLYPMVKIEGLRGLAREDLAIRYEVDAAIADKIVLDGDFSDWPVSEWMKFPDDCASTFELWTPPTDKKDLSARYRFSADDNNLYLALQVFDDKVVIDAEHNQPVSSFDGIELLFAGGSFKGDYPCDGAVLMTMSPTDGAMTFSIVAGTLPYPSGVEQKDYTIHGSYRIDKVSGTINYEVAIPAFYFKRAAALGYYDSAEPKVLFNILVTDRDDPDPQQPISAIEVAPTFSAHIYSVLRLKLFPLVKIPKTLEGWR